MSVPLMHPSSAYTLDVVLRRWGWRSCWITPWRRTGGQGSSSTLS